MGSQVRPQRSSRIIQSLNGLRGTAILMVLCVHLVHISYVNFKGDVGTAFSHILWMGWTGVDLFFVLSGFLITGILLDTQGSPNYFGSFYMRRALRIFPLYYLIVALAALATLVAKGPHARAYAIHHADLLALLLYVQNYRALPITLGHLWSLALEEQFYLLWPLIVFLVRSRRALAWTIAVLLLACSVGRFLAVWTYGRHYPMDNRLYFHGDGLLVGALLALVIRNESWLHHGLRAAKPVAFLSLLGFLWIAFGPAHEVVSRDTYTRLFGFPLLSLLFGALVLLTWHAEQSGSVLDRALSQPFLQVSGKYSYGLYVYHAPVMVLLRFVINPIHRVVDSPLLLLGAGLFGIALSYALALASFHLYEAPILRWKERFRAITPKHLRHPDFPERETVAG